MSKSRHLKLRTLAATFSSGHCIPWHAHRWCQLVYAASGAMEVRTETQTWTVPARRAVWVPVELRHQVSMFGEVQMRTLYFHPEMRVYAGNRCQAVNVSNLMHELILHACTLGIVTPDSVETFSLLKLLICRAKQMEHQPLALPMPSDERASAAARLLLDQPALPLATAAGRCGLSVRSLQRLYRQQTGMSFGRWRNQARMMSAIRLLADGQQVTQVALTLGYESMSAFIFAFRKFFGKTPARYFDER